MSNGTQWNAPITTCFTGCTSSLSASPRSADLVTAQTNGSNTLSSPVNMLASPDSQNIVTLAGNGTAYVYNAVVDSYVSVASLFANPIQGFFGPLGADTSAPGYLTLGGLYTNQTLTVLGGAANASAGTGALRNIVATAPYDSGRFVRLTTPVRANINATATSDARPTLELVDSTTGTATFLAVAPENPRFTLFGTTRFNIPPRSMVIDANKVAYIITVSGLSVVPLAVSAAPTPSIAATRGVVNATDGSAQLRAGGFVTLNGSNLASAATASVLPAPTVLGGSCVTFNDVVLPLLQTSGKQIVGQLPAGVSTGVNDVRVVSLANGRQSSVVSVTVLPPVSSSTAAAGVGQ